MLRRRKQWPADCLSGQVQVQSLSCPRRVDSFVIVPRALRRHGGQQRTIKRQAVSQASIQTYMLTKREYMKEEVEFEEEVVADTKRPCRRKDCGVIDVEDCLKLHCASPKLETSCRIVASTSKHQLLELKDQDICLGNCGSDQDGLDGNAEPDSEPDTHTMSMDQPSPQRLTTQPDSEPETEYVASMTGASRNCVQPSPSVSVGDRCPALAATSDHSCLDGVQALAGDAELGVYTSLVAAVSEMQAMDDTASVISESLLQSARLNDATTISKELKALEQHFDSKFTRDNELMLDSSPDMVLEHARRVGHVVGLALRRTANEAPSSPSQLLGCSLVSELAEFARFAASISPTPSSQCAEWASNGLGLDTLRGRTLQGLGNAAEVASEVWGHFGNIEGYAEHLQKAELVHHVDDVASGCAVWKRLSLELQAAIMLAEPMPPGDDSKDSSWVFALLQRRLRYIAARVAWALECQARDAIAWMREMSFGANIDRSSQSPSTDFAACHRTLQACPVIRDLLHAALRDAAARAAAHLLKNLERVLEVSCRTNLSRDAHQSKGIDCSGTVKREVGLIKDHLAAQAASSCSASLVDFRERWLHGEIEAMGLGRRHREVVHRRHQALRHSVERSESTLQMLRKLTSGVRM